MKIIIGADLVPTKNNMDLFKNGDAVELIGNELSELLGAADYRIFNLETPLTDKEMPIKKCGPNLSAGCKTIKGIKNIGVDLLTVANNHIMDQGEAGFYSTLQTLTDNEIAYVGGGRDLKEASKPHIIEMDGIRIGIYACTEHEFSISDDKRCGANPFDPLYSFDHVSELKNKCNYVIVLYHGGKEHYRYPSPELQRYCRKFIQKGADLVVCQHSHCIGCKEEYREGMIVYGQGNFLFEKGYNNEFWQTALVLSLDIGDKLEVEFIPVYKDNYRVRAADASKGGEILRTFEERSREIEDHDLIEAKYDEFARSMTDQYINSLFGDNLFFRLLNKLCGHRLRARLSEKKRLSLINFIGCEAHRELLMRGLNIMEGRK